MKRVVRDKPTISMLERVDRTIEAPLPNYDVQYETAADRNGLDSWVKMGENETKHLGFGWYDVETWSKRNIRWTTNYGIIFLKNSLPGGEEETLEMEAYCHFPAEGRVWINENRIGEFVIKPGDWQRLCFNFSNYKEVLKVTVRCKTFRPKLALRIRDNRSLGIAVSEIGIVPQQGILSKS